MSDVFTELTRIENAKAAIKTAVGNKGVVIPDTALLGEYPGYIGNIDTDVELTTLNVTANGSYTAPSGYDGISKVTVNVPATSYKSQTLNATANGTYTPDTGYAGFSSVTVAIPTYDGSVS